MVPQQLPIVAAAVIASGGGGGGRRRLLMKRRLRNEGRDTATNKLRQILHGRSSLNINYLIPHPVRLRLSPSVSLYVSLSVFISLSLCLCLFVNDCRIQPVTRNRVWLVWLHVRVCVVNRNKFLEDGDRSATDCFRQSRNATNIHPHHTLTLCVHTLHAHNLHINM